MKHPHYLLRCIVIGLLIGVGQSVWGQVPLYGDSVRSLKKVTLTAYLPDSIAGKTPAVIVFPGGSYCWLDIRNEGTAVAKWLQQEGIAAFVLTYRVVTPAKFATGIRVLTGEKVWPKMFQDATAAMKYIKEHAEEYNVDPQQIGTIGFSAGGHLSLLMGERYSEEPVLKPAFTAAIYPVVTFLSKEHTHRRTRRAALGIYGQGNKQKQAELSMEQHVPASMPPTFLLCCKDDKTVDYENTLMMDSALTAQHVPHQTVVYEVGDHGFGANPEKFSAETAQWQQTFIQWLRTILKW